MRVIDLSSARARIPADAVDRAFASFPVTAQAAPTASPKVEDAEEDPALDASGTCSHPLTPGDPPTPTEGDEMLPAKTAQRQSTILPSFFLGLAESSRKEASATAAGVAASIASPAHVLSPTRTTPRRAASANSQRKIAPAASANAAPAAMHNKKNSSRLPSSSPPIFLSSPPPNNEFDGIVEISDTEFEVTPRAMPRRERKRLKAAAASSPSAWGGEDTTIDLSGQSSPPAASSSRVRTSPPISSPLRRSPSRAPRRVVVRGDEADGDGEGGGKDDQHGVEGSVGGADTIPPRVPLITLGQDEDDSNIEQQQPTSRPSDSAPAARVKTKSATPSRKSSPPTSLTSSRRDCVVAVGNTEMRDSSVGLPTPTDDVDMADAADKPESRRATSTKPAATLADLFASSDDEHNNDSDLEIVPTPRTSSRVASREVEERAGSRTSTREERAGSKTSTRAGSKASMRAGSNAGTRAPSARASSPRASSAKASSCGSKRPAVIDLDLDSEKEVDVDENVAPVIGLELYDAAPVASTSMSTRSAQPTTSGSPNFDMEAEAEQDEYDEYDDIDYAAIDFPADGVDTPSWDAVPVPLPDFSQLPSTYPRRSPSPPAPIEIDDSLESEDEGDENERAFPVLRMLKAPRRSAPATTAATSRATSKAPAAPAEQPGAVHFDDITLLDAIPASWRKFYTQHWRCGALDADDNVDMPTVAAPATEARSAGGTASRGRGGSARGGKGYGRGGWGRRGGFKRRK